MSYIVAYVTFPESTLDYPVDCFRTDLSAQDDVLVRLADGRIRLGVVTRVLYLNWDCKGKIVCKASEAVVNESGLPTPPSGEPIVVGLATAEATLVQLKARGWIPLKARNPYKYIVTHSNESQTANILFRKNGVDFQVLPNLAEPPAKPFSAFAHSMTDGRVVRHYLSQTSFNLYGGVLRFAESFASNENNYDRFFKSVGNANKKTPELKERLRHDGDEPEMSLREALSGCEDYAGRIYLGDGIYI